MQVYFDAGEKGLALRQYEICRDTLRDELGITPGEDTEALRARFLQAPVANRRPGNGGTFAAERNGAEPVEDDRPLVAVLPFDAIGGDPEIDGFSDGLTDDVITGLSRISTIRVVARTTTLAYRRRAVDVREVASELGALRP